MPISNKFSKGFKKNQLVNKCVSERTGILQIIWIELFHCEENYQQLCIFVYLEFV